MEEEIKYEQGKRSVDVPLTEKLFELLKGYPILDTLFNKCESIEVCDPQGKYDQVYCQIFRQIVHITGRQKAAGVVDYLLEKAMHDFLRMIVFSIMTNDKSYADPCRTYPSCYPITYLEGLGDTPIEQCLLLYFAPDGMGSRKLRVEVREVFGDEEIPDGTTEYTIFGDIGIYKDFKYFRDFDENGKERLTQLEYGK